MILSKITLVIILGLFFYPITIQAGQIAFVSSRSGNWELWVMNSNGKDLKQLTDTLEDERWPSFSPDGKQIVFGNNRGELLIINSDGSNLKKLEVKN